MKQKSKIIILIVALLFIISVFIASTYLKDDGIFISYKDFKYMITNNEIEEVTIHGDKILIDKKIDEEKYYTNNPNSDSLKEELLLNDILVFEDDVDSTIGYILDIIMLVMFAGIFGMIGSFIYKNIGTSFKIVKHTNVKFNDIAGLDDLKKEMMVIVDVLKNPSKFQDRGIRQTKGIILEGPPGNGKTLFAKALAEESRVNFIAAKGADFQSAMMSVGSQKIKSLFKKARKHLPCIIFIDEFDSIGERRNYTGTGVDKENNRIITSMLNEMDGFDSKDGLLVIAATNSYHSLDSALIRPGRFDLKYTISNPDSQTRRKLIELYTNKKSLSEEVNIDNLVEALDGQSCAAIETILNEAITLCIMNNKDKIQNMDIINASSKTDCKINVKKLLK